MRNLIVILLLTVFSAFASADPLANIAGAVNMTGNYAQQSADLDGYSTCHAKIVNWAPSFKSDHRYFASNGVYAINGSIVKDGVRTPVGVMCATSPNGKVFKSFRASVGTRYVSTADGVALAQ